MLDPCKQERVEEFLRKALLGEELINTQFHLYSARSSSPPGRVLKPRVLCANNVLLSKNSKYFLDLLSSDINPSDPSLADLTDDTDMPGDLRVDEYGYGSDSDLEDCNDPVPVADAEETKVQSATPSRVRSKKGSKIGCKDNNELLEDGSKSDSSNRFAISPEQPATNELFSTDRARAGSIASSVTAVQPDETGNKASGNQIPTHLRTLRSRHVLVKDTAFQTWYTLLNYLYTGKFNFLPLNSATPRGQLHESSTSPLDEPRCSAKSMYRLACKVGLDDLRKEAFSYIQSNLTEHNILKELSCSLVSKHPQLLEMELDVLYSRIGSPSVVTDFPVLAKRIANGEIPHGADIIVGIHTRLLKTRPTFALEPKPTVPRPPFQVSATPVVSDKAPKAGATATEKAMPPAASLGVASAPPPLSPFSWFQDDKTGTEKAMPPAASLGVASTPPPLLLFNWCQDDKKTATQPPFFFGQPTKFSSGL